MKRICTICARGGSKGVPSKNLRLLAGKPLVSHSITQARASGVFDLVAVSSDSQAILDAAVNAGADLAVMRPAKLASDTAAKLPAIRHCVEVAEETTRSRFDIIADLDATAPLRYVDDIRGAVQALEESDADNVVSGSPARRSPYFNMVELDARGRAHLSKPPPQSVYRRQDASACYDLNGSVYAWRRAALINGGDFAVGPDTLLFVMPEERGVDIDSEVDFRLVEILLSDRKRAS